MLRLALRTVYDPTLAGSVSPGLGARLADVVRVARGQPSAGSDRGLAEGMVRGIVFTPDGRLVISCDGDRVRLREVGTGRELAVCRGHAGGVAALAVRPNGRILASGGADGTVRLWAIPSGEELARWEAHSAGVTALAFDPDGDILASGSLLGEL
jgi:WD40 repeat protein